MIGDRAVRSEGRPGRQIIRRSKETGESDKRIVFPKMEIFPLFDLVVDPFTRTLYWTFTNTNAINVTRLGDEDVTAIDPLMGGIEEGGARMEIFNLNTHLGEVIVNTRLGEIKFQFQDYGF